jgi:hypothetical protein
VWNAVACVIFHQLADANKVWTETRSGPKDLARVVDRGWILSARSRCSSTVPKRRRHLGNYRGGRRQASSSLEQADDYSTPCKIIMYELQHAKAGGGEPLRVRISVQNMLVVDGPGLREATQIMGVGWEAGARRPKTRHTGWRLMLREGAKLGLQARVSRCEAVNADARPARPEGSLRRAGALATSRDDQGGRPGRAMIAEGQRGDMQGDVRAGSQEGESRNDRRLGACSFAS